MAGPEDPPPENGVPDCELVARVRAGDKAAVNALCERYYPRLCNYLGKLVGNDDHGCEIAHETFLKAFKTLQSQQKEVHYFKAWLYRIAINKVKDHWRHENLIRWVPWPRKENDEGNMSIPGPEEQVENAELVRMALMQVSPKYRQALILEIIEELPQREIALLLGKSERTVRRYIARGYHQLRTSCPVSH